MIIFHYCPVCGTEIKPEQKVNGIVQLYVCPNCSYKFWQNSKPTASALLLNTRGELLLTKRGIEPFLDWWDLPGGYLQCGEDPMAGLKREIREELGIAIEQIELFSVLLDQYGETGDFTLNLFYTATPRSMEIKVADDVSGYEWFALDRIPDQLAFNCISQVIQDFIHQA